MSRIVKTGRKGVKAEDILETSSPARISHSVDRKVAEASGGGVTTLDSLTDVSAPTPAIGQVIKWDGVNWVSGDATTEVTVTGTITNAELVDLHNTEIFLIPNPVPGKRLLITSLELKRTSSAFGSSAVIRFYLDNFSGFSGVVAETVPDYFLNSHRNRYSSLAIRSFDLQDGFPDSDGLRCKADIALGSVDGPGLQYRITYKLVNEDLL